MYTEHFGFQEKPFNSTPDPRFLFLSPQHQEALNYLIYGINEKKGFIVITGGVGTGKTLLSRALIANLDESVASALIFNSFISDLELLETINREFGVIKEKTPKTKKEHIDALNEFLLKQFSEGKNAVLIIDESQNLSRDALEQIRMLSNLETDREKLLQIVLLGQPELEETLFLPSLWQLHERVLVRYNLKPLDRENVKQYIDYRLGVAGVGQEREILEDGVYKDIFSYSQGIPRRINALCDRALLIGFTKNECKINRTIIREAIRDISMSSVKKENGGVNKRGVVSLVILLVCAALILMGTIYMDNILNLMRY